MFDFSGYDLATLIATNLSNSTIPQVTSRYDGIFASWQPSSSVILNYLQSHFPSIYPTDNLTVTNTLSAGSLGSFPIASATSLGVVKVDGTTILVNGSGVISSVGGVTTLTAGSASLGVISYNGLTALSGQWDAGSTAPLLANTQRLNYSGNLYVNNIITTGNTTIGGLLTVKGNIAIASGAPASIYTTDSNNLRLMADTISGLAGIGVTISAYYGIGAVWNRGLVYNNKATLPDLLLQPDGGNVGIGIDTPVNRLTIAGNSTGLGFKYVSNVNSRTWSLTNDYFVYGDFVINTEATKAGTALSRFYISPTGNVGIGTISPLSNAGTTGALIHLHDAGGPGWSILHTTNATTGAGASAGVIIGSIGLDAYLYNHSAGSIILATSDVERMRIDSSGNVGVNTVSTINDKLEINGNVRINTPSGTVGFQLQFDSTSKVLNFNYVGI
jgi:hypothetical protein